jgi:hypothetical protein
LKANIPAKVAEVKVMTITAERVAISQRETTSNPSQSSFVIRGMTVSALPHIATFGIPASSSGESRRPRR